MSVTVAGPVPRQRSVRRPVKALVVMGTRPEAIKLAPVARLLAAAADFEPVVVSTGQHRAMLDQMLCLLEVSVAHELGVMRDRQELSDLTARLVASLGEVIRAERPDVVVVQGDTTSAMCGALAAFYESVPVAHVEAGLRTGVATNPFPEELNRRLVGRIARWHFAPTAKAAANLLAEAVAPHDVEVTGNTVIDNLLWVLDRGHGSPAFQSRSADRKRILVTLHRRENQGPEMAGIAHSLRRLADRGDVEVLVPLHKSPKVRDVLLPILGGRRGVTLTEPLDYFDFTATLAACDLVMTDSGGVQEEAPTLAKPTLVLRTTTERPEAIDAGVAKLVGTDPEAVFAAAVEALDVESSRDRPSCSPFGDGHAAERILDVLRRDLLAPATPAVGVGRRRAGIPRQPSR